MNTDLILIIIGFVFIAVITASVTIYTAKKSGSKQEALDFLNGLAGELKRIIISIITSISIDDLKDLDETTAEKIGTSILKRIYDGAWEYIQEVAQKNLDNNKDFFTGAVLAILSNKEFIEKFIRDLLNKENPITGLINDRSIELSYDIAKVRAEKLEKDDEDLQEEFSNQEKYIEEVTDEDQTSGEDINEPTPEDLSKLNPQVDEEEELDPENDPSVEVIDDDIYYDKSGRPRSKKTGKWVKVGK